MLQDAVPEFIKWIYGLINELVFEPIESEIDAALEGVVAEITQSLSGVCGLIPYAGGIICAVLLGILDLVLDPSHPLTSPGIP